MSLWSSLDNAFGFATDNLKADIGGVVNSVLAGVQVRVKTNLGPEFSLGGLAKAPTVADGSPSQSTPGLLDLLGIKFSARLIDAGGTEITHIGDPPDTDPVLIAAYIAAFGGFAYLTFRGLRGLF